MSGAPQLYDLIMSDVGAPLMRATGEVGRADAAYDPITVV
jgi:hypothetical protein